MQNISFSFSDLNFAKDHIDLYEYVLAPIYITFLIIFSIGYKNKHYKKSPLKVYFIPAIWVKIIGAITICFIYNYYYKGGDTCGYYNEGKLLTKITIADPLAGARLFAATGGQIPDDLKTYVQGFNFAESKTSWLIVKIGAFIQFFTFQSFLITSILFGYLSFWGIWRIFKLFVNFYPALERQFAFSFLFLPSVFFWGSGILKDTVCLTSLCILFCSIYELLIERKNAFRNIIYIVITSYLITVLKIYIIMSFAICILILVFLNYINSIKSTALKNFSIPIFAFFGIVIAFAIIQYFGEIGEVYKLDKLAETAQSTRDFIYSSSNSVGAKYSLGEFDASLWGLVKVFPLAVNVTLFRPYLWEAHNFIALFASLENFFLLFLTIKIIISTGIFRTIKAIISNDLIFFCMVFSIAFAFAVGLTSANFGTLVRYKIPCMPFYLTGIYLIQYLGKKENQHVKRFSAKRR